MNWIPIKEKEPQTGQRLIFTGIYGGVFLGSYCGRESDVAQRDAEKLAGLPRRPLAFSGGRHRQVVAWLPLPEPYVDPEEVEKYESLKAKMWAFRAKEGL